MQENISFFFRLYQKLDEQRSDPAVPQAQKTYEANFRKKNSHMDNKRIKSFQKKK